MVRASVGRELELWLEIGGGSTRIAAGLGRDGPIGSVAPGIVWPLGPVRSDWASRSAGTPARGVAAGAMGRVGRLVVRALSTGRSGVDRELAR